MSIMDTIGKPAERPVVVTLCADSGMGKTSLAATFPKPIFIRAEDGLQAVPAATRPDAFPVIAGSGDTPNLDACEQLWSQLMALVKEPHDYKTLVVDSVTALERIFIGAVLEMDPKARSINQAMGGYGAGMSAVAAMHQRVRRAAQVMVEKRGMHVVFIAHAEIETLRLPDKDDYMRYGVRLSAKSLPPYVDDVDVVGFIRLVTAVKGDEGERKKAVSNGDRELICHAVASNISKNRHGIEEPISLPKGQNPLGEFIPALKTKEVK